MRPNFLLLFLFLAATAATVAAEVHVAPSGSDTGDGSAAHPFRTIQNFYWNSVTHAPQVRLGPTSELPDAKSRWQSQGFDRHGAGGFTPDDYRHPAFTAEYPYKPTNWFAGIGKGKTLDGQSWDAKRDYLGNRLPADRPPTIRHIESVRPLPD